MWKRVVVLAAIGLLAGRCSEERQELVFFHSESLEAAAHEIGARFEENHPSVFILYRSAPDLELLQSVLSGNKPDLIAVADGRLIGKLLIPQRCSDYSLIGGDEIVLATDRGDLWNSQHELSHWRENWIDLIFRSGLRFAIADPDRDSLGYYSRLAWKLAEIHYDRQGLYQSFLLHMEEPRAGPRELVAALRQGEVDLIFAYRSTAINSGLKYISLPPQVSLGAAAYAQDYGRVFESIQGPSSSFRGQITGQRIRYAFAPLNPVADWARRFLENLESLESLNLFRALGYADLPVEKVDPQSAFDIPPRPG